MTQPTDSEIDKALSTASITVPEAVRPGVRQAVRALALLAEKLKARP